MEWVEPQFAAEDRASIYRLAFKMRLALAILASVIAFGSFSITASYLAESTPYKLITVLALIFFFGVFYE